MASVRAQEAKIRAARRDLLADRLTQRPEDGDVATLGADSPSAITSSTSTSIEARFDSLAADLIRLERLNLAHLEDIRNLLDETQRREYDRGIGRLFSDSDSNGGAGPQPGPRSGGRAERPRFAN